MEIFKGNVIKTLSIILWSTAVTLIPVSVFGLELGFNQEIININSEDAYDFHLEGTLKSETLPVQVMDIFMDWPPGNIPGFDWTYDGGSITHAGGEYYNYSGKWSGKVPVPPGYEVHIGKAFEVTCSNVFIDLRGWWTDRNGEKLFPEAGIELSPGIWISDAPLLGFEIQDNIPARLTEPNLPQTVTLQNATDMYIMISSSQLAVTDKHIPLEQLVPDSNLLSNLDWRDIPSLPPMSYIGPGESVTFDISEMDLVILPDWTTVIRTEIFDLFTEEYRFYAGKCQAHSASDPTITVSTLDDWRLLLNRPVGEYPRIDPVDADVFADMVEDSNEWPPEYQEAFFATPELDAREHEDESGQMEPALYMRWGPEGESVRPGEYNAAAWDYKYGKVSDLSNVELEFSIHAPRESMCVSVNLIDKDGDWLEFIWHVGLPGEIPACQWTTVKIIPSIGYSNYPLQRSAFEGGPSNGLVDLTRITHIRFDENGIWSEDFLFPLDDGWMWNAWNDIKVKFSPYFNISTLDEWNRLLNRPVGEYPRIDPVDANVFADMVEDSNEWPPEYQEAFFATPELDARQYEDELGQAGPGLYMRWGPEGAEVQPGVYNAASWDYDYGVATDFSNVEVELSILAPQEATRFAVNIIDVNGNWREFIWPVGGPGEVVPRQWTTVRLNPSNGNSNYPLEVEPFDGSLDFALNSVRMIRFNENVIWNGDFPLDNGWVWNVWNNIRVVPIEEYFDGPVAYYPLDGDAMDSSGNGLDGTIVGDPTFAAGPVGMAIDLNGDDQVDCNNPDGAFDITGQLTVAAWINIRSLPQAWSPVVVKGEEAYRISTNSGSTSFHFGINYWQTANYAVNGATTVEADEWHHVCGTYDGATISIYLDGVLDGTIENNIGIGVSTDPLRIGANITYEDRFWDGLIDEVYIYDRALSETEILLLAQ